MAINTVLDGCSSLPDESQQIVRVARVTFGPSVTAGKNAVNFTTTGVKTIMALPAGTVILDAKARVITAFATGQKLTIGDTKQADGLFASADIAPQTAVTTGILKANAVSDYFNATGKLGGYSVQSALNLTTTVTTTGATKLSTSSVGKIELFIVYAVAGAD